MFLGLTFNPKINECTNKRSRIVLSTLSETIRIEDMSQYMILEMIVGIVNVVEYMWKDYHVSIY